jgi:mRNA-degrading endonuclease RelE of RelBE toxin-antitoxin system
MDKIEKFLRSLRKVEQKAMLMLMEQIIKNHILVPGIQPLKGMKNWFRVRMGRYRIIFSIDPTTKKATIERVTSRNEKTYKNLG